MLKILVELDPSRYPGDKYGDFRQREVSFYRKSHRFHKMYTLIYSFL